MRMSASWFRSEMRSTEYKAVARQAPAVDGSPGFFRSLRKTNGLTTRLTKNSPYKEVAPAEPVKDNLVAFARAVRGDAPYPISGSDLINNIALLEAVFKSASSGRIEQVEQQIQSNSEAA